MSTPIQFCEHCQNVVTQGKRCDATNCPGCGRVTSLNFISGTPEEDAREEEVYDAQTRESVARIALQLAWSRLAWAARCDVPVSTGKAYAGCLAAYAAHQEALAGLKTARCGAFKIRGNHSECPATVAFM